MEEIKTAVDSTHPLYDAWLASWQMMRDTADGEEAVKAKTEIYLPKPSGYISMGEIGNQAYDAYLTRAQFPELVGLTVGGMVGVIHRRPATYKLPTALEGLLENATRDGLTLEGLHRRITREILITGRYGILPDLPREGGQPYLAGYTTETIHNWGETDDGLAFVLLDESGADFDPDTLEWENADAWRLIERREGAVTIRTFSRDAGGSVVEGDPVEPTVKGGKRLMDIPFVFVDTNDLTPEPDEIPLLSLGRISLAIYRLDADYRQQLYMTGQEMVVYTGVDEEDLPEMVGSGIAISLPAGADAKVIGPNGTGIAAHRLAIQDDYGRAVEAGARLLSDQVKGAESGDALRIRYASSTATLTTISRNVAAGLERALKNCAIWVGADPDEVEVVPNVEFADVMLTPQQIDSLVKGWQSGAYSKRTMYENLQRGGIANPERDFDDEQLLIEDEAGPLGTLIDEGDDEEDDETPVDPVIEDDDSADDE